MKKIHSAWVGLMLFTASLSAMSQENIRSINYEGRMLEKYGGYIASRWQSNDFLVISHSKASGQQEGFKGDTRRFFPPFSDTSPLIVKTIIATCATAHLYGKKALGSAKYGDVFLLKQVQKEWVQVTLDNGQSAWIHRPLVWGALNQK